MPRVAVVAAALAMMCGCAIPDTSQGTGKLSDTFATPEWAKFANTKPTAQRAITSDDLVTSDGRCTGAADVVTAQVATEGPNAPETTSDALAGQGPLPTLQGGVALAMTECQVVQRVGAPDRVDIGAEGPDRIATMTVMRGPSPGLYRFRGGRLASIERVDVPAPARATKAPKATKSPPPKMRGSQQ